MITTIYCGRHTTLCKKRFLIVFLQIKQTAFRDLDRLNTMQIATIFVRKISTSGAKLSKEMHNEKIRHSLVFDAF